MTRFILLSFQMGTSGPRAPNAPRGIHRLSGNICRQNCRQSPRYVLSTQDAPRLWKLRANIAACWTAVRLGRTAVSGQSLPKLGVRATSAFPPIAIELRTLLEVRFVPTADAARQGVWSAIESQRVSTRWVASSVGTTSVTR